MTMDNASSGRDYIIEGIDSKDANLVHRLESMGLYEGSIVSIAHSTTLGNTISVYAQGTHIALRRSEARCIRVRA